MTPEMMGLTGPPPQAIVNQRPWWFVLMVLLGSTLVFRVLSLDMLGGLLCALMICLCAVILRDGMRELPKFGLMFGLLCSINFVFYAMPVIGYLVVGKSERHVQPVDSSDFGKYGHVHRLTYMLTVKTLPFFDLSRGFLYNVQSAGELLMPIAMLMGTYLGISAHYEYQSHIIDLIPDDEDDEIGREHAAVAGGAGQRDAALPAGYGAILGAAMGGAPPSRETPKPSHKAFTGTAHKLDM